MKLTFGTGSPEKAKVSGLAIGVFDDLDFKSLPNGKTLFKTAAQLHFKGGEGEAFYGFDLFGEPKKHLLVIGLGKRRDLSPSTLRKAAVTAVRKCRTRYLTSAAIVLPLDGVTPEERRRNARVAVEGAILGNERFAEYKTSADERFAGLTRVSFMVSRKSDDYKKGALKGKIMAEATLFARNLVSLPSNVLTPDKMAEEAGKVAKEGGFTIRVLGEAQCKKMGMGAYLAVAKGSKKKPRFIHLAYHPQGAGFHLGLVGKGLTFDSGGISIKPSAGMAEMKSDMAGSAAVLGAMKAVGALKPKVAVDAVMPMAENMPGGGSYRPGDILTTMSGKTIEVLNTDAEGRLTLADALSYVQKEKVDAVIDLATLTGACVVALGPDFTGAMGNNQELMDQVLASAGESGDEVWQLPLPAAYDKLIKSSVADVANIASIRWGGALTAGLFLRRFIEDGLPWVHLDIAGPALREADGSDAHKGEGSGVGVRTLVNFILSKEG